MTYLCFGSARAKQVQSHAIPAIKPRLFLCLQIRVRREREGCEHEWEKEVAIWAASAARFQGNGICQRFPFANYKAKGGGEAFTAETFFTGDFFDCIVIASFEVDDALEVFGGH